MTKNNPEPRREEQAQEDKKKRVYEAPQVKSLKLSKEAAEALT